MCKAWPGLRCTDHPYQKIQKFTAQIHRTENELSTIDTSLQKLTNEHGASVKERPEYDVLTKRKEELLVKNSALGAKLSAETCNYAMSAGGRAKLEEIAENSENPSEVRLNAAADLKAAQDRVEEQKKISKIINNKELSDEEKDAYLAIQQEYQEHKIKELYKEAKSIDEQIKTLKEKIEELDPEKNPRRYASAQKQYNSLVLRHKVVTSEIKQRENLKKEMDRYRDQLQSKITKKLNKVTDGVFKVIDFIIQPNKKSTRLTDPFGTDNGGYGRRGSGGMRGRSSGMNRSRTGGQRPQQQRQPRH